MAQNYWYKNNLVITFLTKQEYTYKKSWDAFLSDGSKMSLIGTSNISLADVRKKARETIDKLK